MLAWLSIAGLDGLGLGLLRLLLLLHREELLLVLETLRLAMWHLLLKMHHVDGSHSGVSLHCGHLSSIESLCAIRHRNGDAMVLLLLLLLVLLLLLLLLLLVLVLDHHSLSH